MTAMIRNLSQWNKLLLEKADSERISELSRFFKCGPGEYGEGDVFIGLSVPDNRRIARYFYGLPLDSIQQMLDSPIHEFRLSALLALVERYKKLKTPEHRKETVQFYVANCHKANNWDLVDLSAPYIIGNEVREERLPGVIDALIASGNLWRQRVAVVSMLTLIRDDMLALPLDTARKMLGHKHMLIKKSVGWILREIGKRDLGLLKDFINTNIGDFSAVTLSYAIEKFDKEEQNEWRTMRKSKEQSLIYRINR